MPLKKEGMTMKKILIGLIMRVEDERVIRIILAYLKEIMR